MAQDETRTPSEVEDGRTGVDVGLRPRRAIIAGLAAQTAGSVPVTLVGATAPELQAEFGFGDAALGTIAATFFLTAALIGPHAGRIVDRLGSRAGLRATGVLVLASLAVEATATSLPMLMVGVVIGALSLAVATPASNVALVEHVDVARRGFAFGLKQSAVPLAATLSGIALPLIALQAGWRWAFAVMIVFPVAAIVLAPDAVGAPASTGGGDRGERSSRPRPPRSVVVLAIVGLFAATSVGTLNPFVVRAATEVGFSTGSAGLLLSVAAGSLIISRVVWGAALDRSAIDPVRLVFALLAIGAVGYGLMATSSVGTFAAGTVVAYAFGWAWPGVQFLAGVRLWPDNPGEASGMLQMGAFIGASAGPVAFGLLVERTGFSTGYLIAAAFAAFAALLALAHPHLSRSRGLSSRARQPSRDLDGQERR